MPSLRSLSADDDVRIKVTTSADNKGVDDAKSGLKGIGDQADNTGSKFTSLSNVSKIALAAVGAGILAVGKTFVQSAADLQQTSKSFEVLTGNVEVANGLFAQLANYANNTPFEFPDIAKAGQTLLGFGIQSDKVFDRIKVLGDIAAATGADFSSLALVFGQVNATGKLMGQDALQLINNQIPIFNILAKKMGIETGKVKEQIEKGAVSADIFNQALIETTKEGGQFFKGTEILAKSFNGRMATLSDTVLEFGRNLIGVKVDDKLGLVVEEGGVFDRLSDLLPKIGEGLEKATPLFVGLVTVIVDSAVTLIDTINNIGAGLAWMYQEFEKGNPYIVILTAAFGGLAAAMTLTATFQALNAGFTLLTTTTIPGVIAKMTALKILVASPMTMGAIAVGAALAAIALVMAAVNEVNNAVAAMNDAAKAKANLNKTNQDLKASANKAYASGDKAKGDKLMSIANSNNPADPSWIDQFLTGTLGKFATGTRSAPGGAALVGEQGPEIVDLPAGSRVYNANDTSRMMSGNSLQIHIENFQVNSAAAMEVFLTAQDTDQWAIGNGLTPVRGN